MSTIDSLKDITKNHNQDSYLFAIWGDYNNVVSTCEQIKDVKEFAQRFEICNTKNKSVFSIAIKHTDSEISQNSKNITKCLLQKLASFCENYKINDNDLDYIIGCSMDALSYVHEENYYAKELETVANFVYKNSNDEFCKKRAETAIENLNHIPTDIQVNQQRNLNNNILLRNNQRRINNRSRILNKCKERLNNIKIFKNLKKACKELSNKLLGTINR